MGGSKRPQASGSTSDENPSKRARGGESLACRQSSGGQTPRHATLSQPPMSCSSRFLDKYGQPQTKSTLGSATIGCSHSSVVWDRVLEIAKEKLRNNNLPQFNLSNLTTHSAEENIEAVVKALNTLQEDDKKKRWSYTWRGKKIIVVEQFGKILKSVEKYSKIVDTAVQSNPQVSALVWAGIQAIMRVCSPLKC